MEVIDAAMDLIIMTDMSEGKTHSAEKHIKFMSLFAAYLGISSGSVLSEAFSRVRKIKTVKEGLRHRDKAIEVVKKKALPETKKLILKLFIARSTLVLSGKESGGLGIYIMDEIADDLGLDIGRGGLFEKLMDEPSKHFGLSFIQAIANEL